MPAPALLGSAQAAGVSHRAAVLCVCEECLLVDWYGKLNSASTCLQIGGNITYNGRTFKDFVIERTSGYVQQNDQHYAPL